MNRDKIIKKIITEVRKVSLAESTGHDWWHLKRVFDLSKRMAKKERADLFLVQLIALLHDLDDSKFVSKRESDNLVNASKLMNKTGIGMDTQQKVIQNIANISFKGTGKNIPSDIEGKIVQDADRLDALGAIGIARAFAYGGFRKRSIYNPAPGSRKRLSDLSKNQPTSLDHFYEKLLLLKDKMNTNTARKLAAHRHKFMEEYLEEFYFEWNGKK